MPLAVDTSVLSAKLPVTLVIAPVPVTLVALAKVIPWLLLAPSLKPTAPVTVVVLLAVSNAE